MGKKLIPTQEEQMESVRGVVEDMARAARRVREARMARRPWAWRVLLRPLRLPRVWKRGARA